MGRCVIVCNHRDWRSAWESNSYFGKGNLYINNISFYVSWVWILIYEPWHARHDVSLRLLPNYPDLSNIATWPPTVFVTRNAQPNTELSSSQETTAWFKVTASEIHQHGTSSYFGKPGFSSRAIPFIPKGYFFFHTFLFRRWSHSVGICFVRYC